MTVQPDLSNRTALVTGGATRIGRALSFAFAGAGAAVAVHYRSSEKEAEDVVREITGRGGTARAVQADLSSEEACRKVVDQAASLAGPLTYLVNSAAAFTREPLQEITTESVLGEFWTNLFSPMFLSRYFAAGNPEGGVIINLLDRRISANDDRFFAYSLTKKGLADFTRLAAVALAPGIKVHGIAPGPILPPPGKDASYLKEKGGRVLIEDALDADAIAEAALALIGLRGATGQVIYIDNGQHLLGNGV